jgi:peptidoglycan hydrolase-like amidase/polyhydroxyalkanoate synthesis regulator phasin
MNRLLVSIAILIAFVVTVPHAVFSKDELEEITKKLEKTQKEYDEVSGDLNSINSKISEITKKITGMSSQITVKQSEINEITGEITGLSQKIFTIEETLERFNLVAVEKEQEKNNTIRELYKASQKTPLQTIFESVGFADFAKKSIYYRTYIDRATFIIKEINGQITSYSKRKEETEKAKQNLENQKANLEKIKATLALQVKNAKEEASGLQSQANALDDQLKNLSDSLEELSEKQEKLLREKFSASSERLTVGDSESGKQTLPNPGFSGTAYAFFTRGYPHRVGMNQYGARGRAEDGQNYKDILDAYYPNTNLEGECDKDFEIPVLGYGEVSLEEYLYGLGEMPSSWPMEALKAQAVAARSYALNYTSGGRSICTDEKCQVYIGREKGGRWNEAVDATCGKYLSYNNSPIPAWYASTAGGFVRSSADVWGSSRPYSKRLRDGKCDNWENCSYDGPEYGDSPWFHKAWGKGTENGPWLTEEQAQDMFNAYLLSNKDSSYNSDLSPADKGGISKDELKEKLESEGISAVGKISKIEVYDDGEGYTTKVRLFSENYNGKDFDGYKFRSIFNLRAPGTCVIWTSFFDILRQ